MKRSVLVGLGLSALLGCDGGALEDGAEPVEQVEAALYNDQNIFADVVNTSERRCNAVFLKNQWALTSANCAANVGSRVEMYATPIQYVDRVIPGAGWTLLHTPQAYDFWGTTTMYQARFFMGGIADLQGQKLTCGTKTAVDVTVNSHNNADRIYFSRANNVKLPFGADQGAVCWRKTTVGIELVGRVDVVDWSSGQAVLFSGASPQLTGARRAIVEPMYSPDRIVCHGPECFTTGASLPNNYNLTTTWEPCSTEVVSAKGKANWTAAYNFLAGDSFSMDGVPYSGAGTLSGTMTLDPGNNLDAFIGVATNSAGNSVGLTSLIATCANARVRATGSADYLSRVELRDLASLSNTCYATAANAVKGCGIITGASPTIQVKCIESTSGTRKIGSISVARPYAPNETYPCAIGSKTCTADVPAGRGFDAYCNYTL